jgi:hypothetical protein
MRGGKSDISRNWFRSLNQGGEGRAGVAVGVGVLAYP